MTGEPFSPATGLRTQIFPTESELFRQTATLITDILRDLLTPKETPRVIVASGRSVTQTLMCLPREALDWSQVTWFLADERCVDPENKERNDRQIREVLKSSLGTKYGLVIGPRPEIGFRDAVSEYASRIENIQMFDFCLLGLGDDGHIASLFPHHSGLNSSDPCILIQDSPKPPAERITLGMTTLRNSENRIVVAAGQTKKKAISDMANNPLSPVRLFEPTDLLFDEAATR